MHTEVGGGQSDPEQGHNAMLISMRMASKSNAVHPSRFLDMLYNRCYHLKGVLSSLPLVAPGSLSSCSEHTALLMYVQYCLNPVHLTISKLCHRR